RRTPRAGRARTRGRRTPRPPSAARGSPGSPWPPSAVDATAAPRAPQHARSGASWPLPPRPWLEAVCASSFAPGTPAGEDGSVLLLCGASGELGGRVARRLSERGADLRVLARPGAAGTAAAAAPGAEVVAGDLRDAP